MIEKIFAWSLDIMLMLVSVLILTLSIYTSYYYHLDINTVNSYKENWELGPILDITSTNDICPQGYEHFISNVFPGNLEGCDCTQSSGTLIKNLYKQKCDAHQIANGCKMIFPHPQITTSIWRGTKLCVLRMNKNFWQLSISNVACASGTKRCGKFDIFNNSLCVMPNEKCPINDIIISNDDIIAYPEYSRVQLNDNLNIFFTNSKVSNEIIVQLIASSSPPCVNPNEGQLGMNNYILNNKTGSPTCITEINNQLNDNRYTLFDKETDSQFKNDNKISEIINKLPLYPKPHPDTSVSLYHISYFGWNKKCFNDVFNGIGIVTGIGITSQERVNSLSNNAYFIAVWTMIHFLFVVFSIVMYKMIFEKMRVSMVYVLIIDIGNFIFLLVILIYSIILLQATETLLSPYRNFSIYKCGDTLTNANLEKSFGDILKVSGYLYPIIVLSIVEIAFLFCYYIWMFVSKKEQYR